MIQVNRIYLIFNRLVTKKFLVDTSEANRKIILEKLVSPPFPGVSLQEYYIHDKE